ncbi:DUF805 domain-containing protein [Sphingobacterium sp. N143]|uniref:DUF805 domain-containing protein n=1 Tax=Sphingobacterium sp. N143 TaxID=2746727 RepID=UPI002577AC27|nr:DUF805 domain-containing protein [Sphingobacterium sp. N143]MDM1296863.1 DUF805 domain-containing protein [Sphingobacterium sp. N143]
MKNIYYIKAFRNIFNYKGRATRGELWYFFLCNLVVVAILRFGIGGITGELYSNIYRLIVLLPGIAVAVRRLHDVGKNGWYLLIPIYNIILTFKKGEPFQNKYGNPVK